MADGGKSADVAVTLDAATPVGVVEMRRGPNNFFDVTTLSAVADGVDELASRGARCVVLCSEGKNFCAGADFTGDTGRIATKGLHVYDVAARLFRATVPMVAAVQGSAVGGGLGLAMAADFRVGSPSTRMTANFALLGFHQGFALSVTLPRAVGEQRAAELLYTGRRVDGATAHAIGLLDHLVAEEELRMRALAFAAEIAAAAPLAVAAIRATLRGDLADRAVAAMAHERAEQDRLQRSADFREGVRAVAERRPAGFRGE